MQNLQIVFKGGGLGHLIFRSFVGNDVMQSNNDKLDAIENVPRPVIKKEVH